MAKQTTGQRANRLRSLIKKGKPRRQKPKNGNALSRTSRSGNGRRLHR